MHVTTCTPLLQLVVNMLYTRAELQALCEHFRVTTAVKMVKNTVNDLGKTRICGRDD